MKILVAGVGNIFMGDDGFGCEVARRLANERLPEGIDVVDFGIRGLDLGYALEDDYDFVLLVDAMRCESAPGSVHLVEPDMPAGDGRDVTGADNLLSPHGMDPARVLRYVASLGTKAPRLILVACEPEFLGGDDGHMGLSEPVLNGVEQALQEIRSVVNNAMSGGDDRLSA